MLAQNHKGSQIPLNYAPVHEFVMTNLHVLNLVSICFSLARDTEAVTEVNKFSVLAGS